MNDKEIKKVSEQEYRRGYRDGMLVAYNEFIGRRFSDKKMEKIFDWMMEGDLFEWYRDVDEEYKFELPPNFGYARKSQSLHRFKTNEKAKSLLENG